MKVALVTTYFKPYEWRSGISNVVYLISKGLVKRGFDVKVFSPLKDNLKKHEIRNKINVERFGYKHEYFLYSKEATDQVKKFSPDVVHSFHYGFYPATAGLKAARELRVPHIFTPAYHPPSSVKKKILFHAYDLMYGNDLIKNSDRIVTFNINEKQQMSRYGNMKIDVVPAPVNNDTFYPKRLQCRKLAISFVGSFLPWKGAGVAMKIFKQIEKERNDVNFFFVGGGTMEQELRKQASKKVRFFVDQPSSTIARIHNMTDIAVFPTFYESFGCAMAEAEMCGTPIVSTRVGAVPETIGNGGILVDYGDWDGMKEAIVRLLDDKKLRKKYSLEAIKHSKDYGYQKVVSRILKSYGMA